MMIMHMTKGVCTRLYCLFLPPHSSAGQIKIQWYDEGAVGISHRSQRVAFIHPRTQKETQFFLVTSSGVAL